jgi:ABC-type branched-subunit amino acid transport system ATPase component
MHDEGSRGAVLAFDNVSVPSVSNMTGLAGVTFELRRGDVMLVRLQEGHERTLLADVAQGVVTPVTGRVSFLGEDWESMGAGRQGEQRGRMRRVFEHYGWIANLDVMENICLSECHHTGRREADIAGEALVLARRFGLDGIPAGRPTRQHPMVLRRLEWVRAFIGTPDVVILERPLFGAPKADMGRLVEAVCTVSRGGTAVVWLTDDNRDWDCGEVGHVRRFEMSGESLVER